MSQVFKGFIDRINEKTGSGRKGPWTLYSTILKDEKGEDATGWLSFGFDRPDVKSGDYVKVTVEEVDGRERVTDIKKLKNPPARGKAQAATATAGSGSTGTSSGGPDKQSSIHYQNSRTAAISAVSLLIDSSALALPKAGTKPAEAKRFAIIIAAIDKLTIKYYNDLESMRLLETVADSGVVDTKPDAPLPADADGDDPEDEEEEQDEEEEDDDE